MTEGDHFTIDVDSRRLKDILKEKGRLRDKSQWICRSLLAAYDREQKGTKIDAFLSKNGKLDIMPPVWDEWTWNDLKDQKPEDMIKLRHQMERNLGLLNRHIASLRKLR